MATPPRLSMAQRKRDLELHNQRLDRVKKEVGANLLGAFELWAFKAKTPMIYDGRVVFIWQCAHATKETLPEDLDEAIDLIVQLWKDRFGTDDE